MGGSYADTSGVADDGDSDGLWSPGASDSDSDSFNGSGSEGEATGKAEAKAEAKKRAKKDSATDVIWELDKFKAVVEDPNEWIIAKKSFRHHIEQVRKKGDSVQTDGSKQT